MTRAAVHYTVTPVHPEAHLFEVVCRVAAPEPSGQLLRLPSWIPGSYMIREFAKNIVQIRAEDSSGAVPLTKVDKDTWRARPTDGELTVTYQVYAWDLSVRCAHLDQTHGFFNGTSVFLAAVGQEDTPHSVEISPPESRRCREWRVATTLPRVSGAADGFGVFQAADYDQLVDHPVEMGTFRSVQFEARGVPHEVVLTGPHRCDEERLVRDLTAICTQHIDMFGGKAPFDRYLFLVMVVGDGYGGLEHRDSTALICRRDSLPLPGADGLTDGYRNFLGLCSHEYFHSWNVKRLKPAVFLPYDLSKEGYTSLLWAFEGITSYYDDLAVLRSGCMSVDDWLELVGQTATRVHRGSGRLKQSLADSSFDAWTKFYRQDENAPNAIVSYYAKGALMAMALDLTLRERTDHRVTLDDVMRALWARYGAVGVGVPEDGVEAMATELAGQDLSDFFSAAIHGTDDIDLPSLLERFGVLWKTRGATALSDKGGKSSKPGKGAIASPGSLGAHVTKTSLGAKLKNVHDGSAAQDAGLSAGDVVIAVEGLRVTGANLDSTLATWPAGSTLNFTWFRRDELMQGPVTLRTPAASTVFLKLSDEPDATARRRAWLLDPADSAPA